MRILLAVVLAAFFTAPANAALINWSLSETFFDNGSDASFGQNGTGFGAPCPSAGTCGSVQGFFLWDTVAETAVDWSFTVSGGDTATFSEFTYTPGTSSLFLNPSSEGLAFERTSGLQVPERLIFEPDGNFVSLNTASTQALDRLTECFNCSPFRDVSAATSITGVVVPLPATGLLLLAGLGGLALVRGRRAV